MEKIVTKEKLMVWVERDPINTIGRALVAIFNNQLPQEQASNNTVFKNGIGFTGADGRIGALGAKYYLKHRTLEDWQLRIWLGLNSKGQPRIVKYAEQLNQVALIKQSKSNYDMV